MTEFLKSLTIPGWFVVIFNIIIVFLVLGAILKFVLKKQINFKKCQFCAERIQTEAVVCRFCNRDLN